MVTRVIRATVKMACCRNGQQAYNPHPREVIATQTKGKFDEPIKLWGKRAEELLYEKYHYVAENECSTMGTLRLCSFSLMNVRVSETRMPITETEIGRTFETKQIERPKVSIPIAETLKTTQTPNFIYQQLELIRERMVEADSIEEFLALKNEMNKLKGKYNI